MFYYYYFDYTYVLVIIGALICCLASVWVTSSMKKYHGIKNQRGLTGAQAAEQILRDGGIYDVGVQCLRKGAGDHYNPRTKTVGLSYETYHYPSVTAVAIAAHECGHAKQHQENFVPLRIRSLLVPVVNIGTYLGIPLIILGVYLSFNQTLIQIGIWAFVLAMLFQIVTLPVEFNASNRALASIENRGMLNSEEYAGAKKVLTAAAMTYVAATASSVLQLIRLVLLFGGNRRRD